MDPIRYDLTIPRGTTFVDVIRWGQESPVAFEIASISTSSPAIITTLTEHQLPDGDWPVWLFEARLGTGNEPDDVYWATRTGTNTLTIPVSTLTRPLVRGRAEMRYYPPMDLTGYTGRMQIRPSTTSDRVLRNMTTENGGLVLDPVGLISLVVDDSDGGIDWAAGVYDLELVAPSGDVIRFAYGDVETTRNSTREEAP